MLTFKRTTITINGEAAKGYSVEGLDNSLFRGLQVVLVKDWGWKAYEATTGLSITPSSWAGGFSNKTREGIIQIVSNFLSNAPESGWVRIQEQLDYDLEKSNKVDATELRLARKGAKALYDLLTRLNLPEGLTDTVELTQTQIESMYRIGQQIARNTEPTGDLPSD